MLSRHVAGLSAAEFVALVEAEWRQRGHLPPGHLARGWRHKRALYRLRLPSGACWGLLEHPALMAAYEARRWGGGWPLSASQPLVSRSCVTPSAMPILLADWVRGLTRRTAAPHGIRYDSQYATGATWAYLSR